MKYLLIFLLLLLPLLPPPEECNTPECLIAKEVKKRGEQNEPKENRNSILKRNERD